MIAHVRFAKINNNEAVQQASTAHADAFEARMQDCLDQADYLNVPTRYVSMHNATHDTLPRYNVTIEYLNDTERDALQKHIAAIVEESRQEESHAMPPPYAEMVNYDAPNSEEGQIFSLTYLLSSHIDVDMLFDALDTTDVDIDNQDAVNKWRDVMTRHYYTFERAV